MPQLNTPSRIPLHSTPTKLHNTPTTPRPASSLGFGRFTPSLPLGRSKPPPIPNAKSPYHTAPRTPAPGPASPTAGTDRAPHPKSRLDTISSLVRSASRLGRNGTPRPNGTTTPAPQKASKPTVYSPMSPPILVDHPSRPSPPLVSIRARISAISPRKDGRWAAIHLEWAEYDGDLSREQKQALEGAECLNVRDPWEEFNPDRLRARFLLGRKPQTLPPLPSSSIAMIPLAPPSTSPLSRPAPPRSPPRLPASLTPPARIVDKPLPSKPRTISRKPVPPSSPSPGVPRSAASNGLCTSKPVLKRVTQRLGGPRPNFHSTHASSPFSRSPPTSASTSPTTPPLIGRAALATPSPPFARPLSQQVAGKMFPRSPPRAPWR